MRTPFAILILFVLPGSSKAQDDVFPRFTWMQPQDTVIYHRAVDFYQAEKFAEAIRTLRQLPPNTFALAGTQRLVGLCALAMEDFSAATTAFSKGLSKDPKAVGLYYDRAFAYMHWEKYKEAAGDFRIFAEYFPDSKPVALNLANSLNQAGETEKAIQHLEAFPDRDSTIVNSLAWYYIENQDYDQAIFLLEPLVNTYPDFASAYETLSIAFSGLGYTTEAIQAVDILMDLQPEYGRAYYLKGAYLEESDREDEAEPYFRKAKQLGYGWEEY